MKKLSSKQRKRYKSKLLFWRVVRRRKRVMLGKRKRRSFGSAWRAQNDWLIENDEKLNYSVNHKNGVTLVLPPKMNLSVDYEQTALYLVAIRKLVKVRPIPASVCRLVSVDFGELEQITTSAALALTAELSRWDDSIRTNLKPLVGNWNQNIYDDFTALGFFDLFKVKPARQSTASSHLLHGHKIVRYIKGSGTEVRLARQLRKSLVDVIGEEIKKWNFLRHGLDEAILNAHEHAYPDESNFFERHKSWYMTGSYNPIKKHLKVVFYDQGIGIPEALPAWSLYERSLQLIATFGIATGINDANLIKASMKVKRTRTGESDRGKGLPDMLDFINQQNKGYLAVMSSQGLYKHSNDNGVVSETSASFVNPINGTMIIWSVELNPGNTKQ